jgi:hypothetical protein
MSGKNVRRRCVICDEHRAEKGDYCARCWAEFREDIERGASWIAEMAERRDSGRRRARASTGSETARPDHDAR